MAQYALTIGIKKSGKLPPLVGALTDAHAFAEWASKQNYIVHSVTDKDNEPVTIDRLKDEIKVILKEDVSRLLIYYSGHGICTQAGDYWLLSNYDRDADEAVNLFQSIRNARRLGLGQIAVFSDACRSSLDAAALVSGRVIFPIASRHATTTSPYDEFLSTDIGNAAQEVPGEDPAKSYGVFTRCLLTALHGLEPDAAEDRVQRKVISSVALANWLEKKVPLQSGKIPGAAVQYPSITPSWRAPNDEYAECHHVPKLLTMWKGMSGITRRMLSWSSEGALLDLSPQDRRAESQARVTQGAAARERTVNNRFEAFMTHRGRENFEIYHGLTVIGRRIIEIHVPPGVEVELFEEAGLWHVRSYGRAHAAALRTDDNLWIAATVLPEFIGTLIVGENGVESLNYAPSHRSPERDPNLRSEEVVARWNALLGVQRHVNSLESKTFADEVREVKHINPAFGVLAAYAYERSGSIDQIASVGWYFAKRNNFVPFDIMSLLSAYGDPVAMIRACGPSFAEIEIAGYCPMLTQGWSFLDTTHGSNPDLVRLRAGLMDSVWTTFNAETGSRFAQMIAQQTISP